MLRALDAAREAGIDVVEFADTAGAQLGHVVTSVPATLSEMLTLHGRWRLDQGLLAPGCGRKFRHQSCRHRCGPWTNADIGRALYISEATVKTHLLRVFNKLDVSDRTAAVTTAMARGLLA